MHSDHKPGELPPHSIHGTNEIMQHSPPEKNSAVEETTSSTDKDKAVTYPPPSKLALILMALYATTFLVALDRTIIAPAVPRISLEFHALDDISWYAGAYLLASCSTQLLWGRIYVFYSTKIIFLVSVVVFEIGSAVCGAAPTSTAFIIGRAIAGMGSAGIFSGSSVILTQVVPLEKRPMWIGLMGSMFGLASIVGPLVGGGFTDNVSWRWCFYINLPIGGVVFAIILFFFQVPAPLVASKESPKRQFIRMDPIGTLLFLPSVVCFLLALQWGGDKYPWSNGRVIALFVVAGALGIAFIAVQVWRQEDATIPPRIIKQRSVLSGVLFALCVGGGLVSMVYCLPIWFQAIKGVSAVRSGIDMIPLVLSLVFSIIVSGIIIEKTGYFVPWMIASAVFMSIGAGLITTLKVDTAHASWIGYQILFGLGLGMGMQQPSLAAQTVLSQQDVSIGISLMFFAQSLGGAVFVATGQALFINRLSSGVSKISGVDVDEIVKSGATNLASVTPSAVLESVRIAYNHALRNAFVVVVAISCFAIIPTLTMEWKSIKAKSKSGNKAEESEA